MCSLHQWSHPLVMVSLSSHACEKALCNDSDPVQGPARYPTFNAERAVLLLLLRHKRDPQHLPLSLAHKERDPQELASYPEWDVLGAPHQNLQTPIILYVKTRTSFTGNIYHQCSLTLDLYNVNLHSTLIIISESI